MKAWPILLLLMACGDETVTAFAETYEFRLISIAGAEFQSEATINIGKSGAISGRAPCNSYGAQQTAPYPRFDIGPIAATKRACPDLALEATFFQALYRMTLVEVVGDTLILSNDAKEELVFQAP